MSSCAIKIEDLSKSFANKAVLQGLKLSVAENEFFGLVGVNGAGKTTLIKSMLDFCDINAGSIEIFGVPHTRVCARRRLAYLPERFVPPGYLTGREFLDYMAGLYGDGSAQPEAGILQALDLQVAALGESVGNLSKGMSQKLGLAACLLSDKELFVLDEPMSGLDPKARALFKRYLRAQKDQGKTLFFSTHLLVDVGDLCDRMAVLHDGQVKFAGAPAEFMATYGSASLEDAYLRCVTER